MLTAAKTVRYATRTRVSDTLGAFGAKRRFPRRLLAALVVLLSVGLASPGAPRAEERSAGVRRWSVIGLDGPLAGRRLSLDTFRRRAVYLVFWATWCKPCLDELRALERLYRRYRSRGFTVFSISVDQPQQRSLAAQIVRRLRLTYPVAFDDKQQAQRRYKLQRQLPYSLLFDRQHKLRARRRSFRLRDGRRIERQIVETLGPPRPEKKRRP